MAHPHGILITWATITEGGFQVNTEGRRFSDESKGYSEQAARVVSQPGGVAFSIFDARIADIARQFEDFRLAEGQGALVMAGSWDDMAGKLGLDAATLSTTMAAVDALKIAGARDAFGRDFAQVPRLTAPYCAVRVEGALFHTQGGLQVNAEAQVLRPDGSTIPGLYAAGGAACGVSGPEASGYLSGNGLLTAVALGGSLIGFVLPLSKAVAQAVSIPDMLVWGIAAFVVQLLAYLVCRFMVPDLSAKVGAGQMAAGVTVASVSLGAGLLNAASMSV